MLSVQDLASAVQRVINNVEKVIVGKAESVAFSLIAVICQGHVLIEDVPGVGKTVLTKAIARSIGCTFKRIQFTPDLLPSDVTGVSIYNQKTANFEFRAGPILAQIVLADEINRATPKTHRRNEHPGHPPVSPSTGRPGANNGRRRAGAYSRAGARRPC